jgi:hypothetical protein
MTDSDKLQLVRPSPENESGEFLPLPYMPWDRRPSHISLEVEECATALYLEGGVVERAAGRLRCEPLRLIRAINRSARLTRLHQELASLLNDKVHQEYLNAFSSEDDRRREWAASKVSGTKQFQGHPLAPNANQANLSLPGPATTRIIISWDDGSTPEGGDE